MYRPVRSLPSQLFDATFVALWLVACLLSPLSGSHSSHNPSDNASLSSFNATCLLYAEPSDGPSVNRLCQTNWDAEYPSGGLLSLEISRRSSDLVLRSVGLSQDLTLVTPLTLGVALRL